MGSPTTMSPISSFIGVETELETLQGYPIYACVKISLDGRVRSIRIKEDECVQSFIDQCRNSF